MFFYLKKAFWILKNRPIQFMNVFRGFFLFRLTKIIQPLLLNPANGITLEQNVRIQRLSTLTAERPNAHIHIGADSIIYENAKIEAYGEGQIILGEKCVIGDARIYARSKVTLGKRVVTSWNVFIQDFDPHPLSPELRSIQLEQICENFRPSYKNSTRTRELNWTFPTDDIEIGDDVWLGANTTVLKGAKIGAGCVLATGAVVTAGVYPPGSILGGVPAKMISKSKSSSEQTAILNS